MEIFKEDIYDDLKYMPQNREIAIWGVCQESLEILVKAINIKIQVKYFVDIDGNYKGPDIFDKKVILRNQLCNQENIFVIISAREYEKNKKWIKRCLEGRYYIINPGKIDYRIQNSNSIYIYGAGISGKKTLQILKENMIEIKGFIDSDEKKQGKEWCNYCIYNKQILKDSDVVIVSSIYYSEIYRELIKNFNGNNVFIDYGNSRGGLIPSKYDSLNSPWIKYKDYPVEPISVGGFQTFFATLWNDFWNKRIVIYGNNEITKQVIDIFALLGISIAYIVDDDLPSNNENTRGYIVKNIDEVSYEDLKGKIIITSKVNDDLSIEEKRIIFDEGNVLKSIGLKYFEQFRPINNMDYYTRKCIKDGLLRHVQIYEDTQKEYTGFHVLGNVGNYKRKIVILGNSTSDGGTHANVATNWTIHLAKKYEDVVIYNGSMQGYDVIQECLKLLRDIRQLKVGLIISYSGVNEVGEERSPFHPFVKDSRVKLDTWYGIEDDIAPSEFWIYMERYMQAIASVNGSEFISILQPALCHRKEDELTKQEKLLPVIYGKDDMFMNNYKEFTRQVKEKMSEYNWMYDLTDVFDGVNETVFRDMCHLTNRGNEIVAERILKIIDKYYKNR